MRVLLLPLATILHGIGTCAGAAPSASWQERYFGEAWSDGELVYREHHAVSFDLDGKVQRARTEYRKPDGELFAVLESDFSQSMTSPAHEFRDFRFGHRYGLRIDDGNFVLFSQDEEEEEKTRLIDPLDTGDGVMFGCQGLHYYLRENFERVNARKKLPILLLAPKNLESYAFQLQYRGDNQGEARYELAIDNFLLRLFAPKFIVLYDLKQKRLVRYEGLSNLLDDERKSQTVDIRYVYPDANADGA